MVKYLDSSILSVWVICWCRGICMILHKHPIPREQPLPRVCTSAADGVHKWGDKMCTTYGGGCAHPPKSLCTRSAALVHRRERGCSLGIGCLCKIMQIPLFHEMLLTDKIEESRYFTIPCKDLWWANPKKTSSFATEFSDCPFVMYSTFASRIYGDKGK